MDWMIAASFVISGVAIGMSVASTLILRGVAKEAERRAEAAQHRLDAENRPVRDFDRWYVA